MSIVVAIHDEPEVVRPSRNVEDFNQDQKGAEAYNATRDVFILFYCQSLQNMRIV